MQFRQAVLLYWEEKVPGEQSMHMGTVEERLPLMPSGQQVEDLLLRGHRMHCDKLVDPMASV